MKAKNLRLRRYILPRAILTLTILGAVGFLIAKAMPPTPDATAESFEGMKVVLVRYQDADFIDADSSSQEIVEKQALIADVSEALNESLSDEEGHINLIYNYKNFPLAAFEVDSQGELALKNNPNVKGVMDYIQLQRLAILPDPVTTIGGSPTLGFSDGNSTFDGTGYSVVIMDDGVDKNHPALSGKIINEFCMGYINPVTNGDTTLTGVCPGGTPELQEGNFAVHVGNGVASNCIEHEALGLCEHGTRVAAAAAMPGVSLGNSENSITTSGTAAGAKIVAIQIASKQTSPGGTTSNPDMILSLLAFDILAFNDPSAFSNLPIASVNFSVGAVGVDDYASSHTACEARFGAYYEWAAESFAILRAKGIAPVIAAGNSGDKAGFTNKISFPACVEGAIAVGATNITGTAMAYYSDNAPITTLLAPGGDVYDSAGGMILPVAKSNEYAGTQGTSFAAPMVAGAFAVMRQKYPSASVSEIVSRLQTTGKPINDTRAGYTVGAKPLIQLNAALADDEPPAPTVTSVTVSPSSASVEKGETRQFTTTVAGTNNPPQTVTWTVIGGGAGTSISTGGLLTVASGETATSLTVRACSALAGFTTVCGTSAVTVTEPVIITISNLTYPVTQVIIDTAFILEADITGATSCSVNNGGVLNTTTIASDPYHLSVSLVVKTGQYTLTCSNPKISESANFTLDAIDDATPRAVIANLTYPTNPVVEGTDVLVEADITDAAGCFIIYPNDGGISGGAIPSSPYRFSRTISAEHGTYRLSCVNSINQVTEQTFSLNIQQNPTRSVIIVDPSYPNHPLIPGEEFLFEATIIGADACSMNHGIGDIPIPTDPYFLSMTLPARAGYILTCINSTGGNSIHVIALDILGGGIDVPNTGRFAAENDSSSIITIPVVATVVLAITGLSACIIVKRNSSSKKMRF